MRCSAAEYERKIDLFIEHCRNSGDPPTSFVMRQVMGITKKQFDELRQKGESYERAAEKLDEFRTYFWIKKGLDDPRWATFSTFNLKQADNGGFSDKPEGQSGEVVIRVDMSGVGPEAFS